jgi:membrane fusion protein (multidrug efflux system)
MTSSDAPGAGRRFLFVVIGLAAALIVAAGARLAASRAQDAPRERQAGAQPALAVAATAVQDRDFSEALSALGVAKARRSVVLSASATELATRILFASGQHVAQGQVLAELKADEQRAGVANAQAVLEKARSDDTRWESLSQKGFAPKAQVEQYRAALRQAEADVNAAQSRLKDRVIRAPFSGVIGLTDAAPGMVITPGAPIATLDDLSVIYVDFDVPEARLTGLAPHAPVKVVWTTASGPVELSGEVLQLDTRVKPDTHTLTVRAAVRNSRERLKPGMLLRVTFAEGRRRAPAIPETALQVTGDASSVYLLKKNAKGWTAVARPVQIGAHQDGAVEIVGGLQPGDLVVADGLNRLRPGQAVSVVSRAS